MRKSVLIHNGTKFLLFLNTFAAETIFRTRAYADKSVDFQVLFKTGVWAVSLVFCLAFFRYWGHKLLRIDNVFQVLLLALIVISCFYAPFPAYSFASAFSLTAVLFMLLISSSVLSSQELLRQIIYGGTLVIGISILVYLVNPDFGRMKVWENGVLVMSDRLSGITGTANASGYISALCLIMLYYYRKYLPRLTPAYWLFVLINLAGLILSNSRTAMTALIVSITIAGIVKASPTRLAALFLGICISIIILATLDYDAVFALLARSGDASEITTGTGRTAIWGAVVQLIHERPFFGWGYGAGNTLLPERSGMIGFTVNHAHNAFLQIALSVGYVGLLVFVTLIGMKVYYSLKSRDQLNIALIFFLLIDGLTEPIAFQGVATTTTLALATVLALNYRYADETPDSSPK